MVAGRGAACRAAGAEPESPRHVRGALGPWSPHLPAAPATTPMTARRPGAVAERTRSPATARRRRARRRRRRRRGRRQRRSGPAATRRPPRAGRSAARAPRRHARRTSPCTRSRAARGRETPASRDRIPRVPGRATAGPRDRMHEGETFPTLEPPPSATFDSFRLILGRAIISRGVLKERMLFLSTICRDTSNFKRL